jgi:anaerobic magnesium-protoporphyrin IX monomethyl ester cyclase
MKKRVLLINPPYPMEELPTPPFGLMSLAAYLLGKGCEVMIDDYIVNPFSRRRVRGILREFRPDVIGSTGVTMNINAALSILKDYREESPGTPVVMGGPHVTFDAGSILSENGFVDYVVRGEGEETFAELLDCLDDPSALPGISGISYRGDGAVVHNQTRDFIKDINVLPFPARHLVQLSKYKALGMPLNMLTSRGCPYECIFCVGSRMIGRKVRYFGAERVVDEFEMLSKMGFKQVNFVDDLFTSNRKRCTLICEEIIRRGIKHPWTAFARVDTVNRELLRVMKAAGCFMLCFGIESGVQEILDGIKKKTTLEKIRNAMNICDEVGVEPMGSYIMGLPGETPDTIRRSMEFARNFGPNHGFHVLAPFPGTEVREKAESYGIKILSSDWDRYDANQVVCETATLSREEMERIVRELNSKANSRLFEAIHKQKKGEVLSREEEEMISILNSFVFSLKMISDELVENYSSVETNGSGVQRFIEYVTKSSGFDGNMVSKELERLFRLGCLTNSDGSEGCRISWSSLPRMN